MILVQENELSTETDVFRMMKNYEAGALGMYVVGSRRPRKGMKFDISAPKLLSDHVYARHESCLTRAHYKRR